MCIRDSAYPPSPTDTSTQKMKHAASIPPPCPCIYLFTDEPAWRFWAYFSHATIRLPKLPISIPNEPMINSQTPIVCIDFERKNMLPTKKLRFPVNPSPICIHENSRKTSARDEISWSFLNDHALLL